MAKRKQDQYRFYLYDWNEFPYDEYHRQIYFISFEKTSRELAKKEYVQVYEALAGHLIWIDYRTFENIIRHGLPL